MDARDKIIEDLRKLVAKQSEQIAKLTARVAELELALAKATKDSSTSSKPPSSDITKPKTSKKPGRRGKPKRGGQPGHQQHLRASLPPERVDETFDYEITNEDVQRLDLKPTDEFETNQFIELPESPVIVTEHRLRVSLTADDHRNVHGRRDAGAGFARLSGQALHGIDCGFAGQELPGTEGCNPSAGTTRQR